MACHVIHSDGAGGRWPEPSIWTLRAALGATGSYPDDRENQVPRKMGASGRPVADGSVFATWRRFAGPRRDCQLLRQ